MPQNREELSPADIIPATRGIDSLNNLEQVVLDAPEAGTWTLRVAATSLMAAQEFSLAANVDLDVVSLDMSCVTATSPTGRVTLTADARNNLDAPVAVRAEFSVENCDGSTVEDFRWSGGTSPRGRAACERFGCACPRGSTATAT